MTKGKIVDPTNSENKIFYQYASISGICHLCVCGDDGKIVGGMINFILGEHAYGYVIGHDKSYDYCTLGEIVLMHTIDYLIEGKNIKYFHLLNGTQAYKYHHGGINHYLYNVMVFKNNDINYYGYKTINSCKVKYTTLRRRIKQNKTIFRFYSNLKRKINRWKLHN